VVIAWIFTVESPGLWVACLLLLFRTQWAPEIRTYCSLLKTHGSEANREWVSKMVAAGLMEKPAEGRYGGDMIEPASDEHRMKAQQEAGFHDTKPDVNEHGTPYRSSPPFILIGMKIDLRQQLFLFRERQQMRKAISSSPSPTTSSSSSSSSTTAMDTSPTMSETKITGATLTSAIDEKYPEDELSRHKHELCTFEDGLNMARVYPILLTTRVTVLLVDVFVDGLEKYRR
jgi:hypothetical protein